MPQELQVLKCFSCETFQVQIVKKVPKWQCKTCNEKQSVKKVYATGSGKDCRKYVQGLNMKRGELALAAEEERDRNCQEIYPEFANCGNDFSADTNCGGQSEHYGSKWSYYLDPSEEESHESTDSHDTFEDCSTPYNMVQDSQPTKKRKRTEKQCEGSESSSRWSKYSYTDDDHQDKPRNNRRKDCEVQLGRKTFCNTDLGSSFQFEENYSSYMNPTKLQEGKPVISPNSCHAPNCLSESSKWSKYDISPSGPSVFVSKSSISCTSESSVSVQTDVHVQPDSQMNLGMTQRSLSNMSEMKGASSQKLMVCNVGQVRSYECKTVSTGLNPFTCHDDNTGHYSNEDLDEIFDF